MPESLPKRSEIPQKHTWDASSVYPSDEAWQAEIAHVQKQIANLDRYQGRLGESASILADWLQEMSDLTMRLQKIRIYAGLFHHVDTADTGAAAKHDRARTLLAQGTAAMAFAEPEILAIDPGTLQCWQQEEPRLAIYAHYFDQLEQRRPHVRAAEVEALLGGLADPFRTAASIHSVLADADLKFPPVHPADPDAEPIPLAQGTIRRLLASDDRQVRRNAWEQYAGEYLAHKNTMANCLATGVKQNVFMARARRYDSALEAALAPNRIPVDIFHNTINTFRQHLPTWHRYWRVRRQALGYEKLHPYDVAAPLTAVRPQVSFEQAMDWIAAGMQPLGAEYVRIMKRGVLQERWVDIYPNQNKRSGAFSSGFKGTHPFILTSHTDTLFGMSTLAHELGHSMHSYYTWQNQPVVYSKYSLFVAEVASNFNQALVRAYLLDNNDDPDFQIALLEEAMANFHRYFFIMPTLARFELEIHQRVERGEALTADSLIALMADLFREGFGEEVEMDEERVGITWAQFPTHLYANFYVYQYTTGIAAAHALAEKVLAEEPEAAENYLAFLKTGDSLYPLEALKVAGVDMASPEPVEKTFAVLAKMVDRLEALAG